MIRLRPIEVLDHAIRKGVMLFGDKGNPGDVILKLTPEQRECLQQLKAEHIQVRIERLF